MNKFDIGETVVFKEYERPERTATFQNYSQSYGLEVAIKQRKPLEVVDIDVGIDGKAIQVYDLESKLDGVVEPQNFELYEPDATQTIKEATDYPEQAFDGYVAQLKDSSDSYPYDMFYAYSESTSVAGTKYTKHHLVSSVSKARIYKDKLTARRAISKMNNASNLNGNEYKMRYVSYDPDKQMYILHSEQVPPASEVEDLFEDTNLEDIYVIMRYDYENFMPLYLAESPLRPYEFTQGLRETTEFKSPQGYYYAWGFNKDHIDEAFDLVQSKYPERQYKMVRADLLEDLLEKERAKSKPASKEDEEDVNPVLKGDLLHAEDKIQDLLEENKELKEQLEGNQEYINELMEMHKSEVDKKLDLRWRLNLAIDIIIENDLTVSGEILAQLLRGKEE